MSFKSQNQLNEVYLKKKFLKFDTVKVRFGSAEQFGQFSAEQFGSAELKIKKFGSVRHENLLKTYQKMKKHYFFLL